MAAEGVIRGAMEEDVLTVERDVEDGLSPAEVNVT